MHHRHYRTPLWVSVVAALAMLVATTLLFGGVTHAAADEAQSSSGITTEVQSVNTTAQSSGAVTTTAATNTSSGVAVAVDATTDSNCTPRPISAEEIQTDLKTQDGSMEYTAYEAVEFAISLTLFEGHCAGDGIVITVPSELGTDGSFDPIPMTTPDGVTIGVATYHPDRTVSISLTSEVENPSRKDFRASAWWRVHMESSLTPGETRELQWSVDGVVRRTTIQVGVCNGCSTIGAEPSKWGFVNDNTQSVTVVLPTATQDNQEFVVTDKLTSPGQHFACDNLIAGRVGVYTSANDWGAPQYSRFQEPDITSCDNSKAVINVRLNKGEKARVQLNVLVDSADPGPWTDTASIVSQDQSWETSARVVRRESGGNAGFDTNPTPTPTPTPEPTPTPAPSPSPSAPAPTPSTSPTPSPSAPNPSATPNPTPSPSTSTPVTPTPAPSASPTPSTSPTPSVTPTPSTTPEPAPTPSTSPTPSVTPTPVPSTTPAPSQTPVPHRHRLPVTGSTTVSVATSAIALLAIGGVAIWWARRRQAARSK